jgi:hypothetical protein
MRIPSSTIHSPFLSMERIAPLCPARANQCR